MDGYRRWADPPVAAGQRGGEAATTPAGNLHTSLALLPVDDGQVEYLYRRLLERRADRKLPVIRDALAADTGMRWSERLWGVLERRAGRPGAAVPGGVCPGRPTTGRGRRNRRRWQAVSPFVADQLLAAVQQNPSHYTPLLEMLRPVRERLLAPLAEVYRDRGAAGCRAAPAPPPSWPTMPATSTERPGRPAHGRRREAVRRAVPEVRGPRRPGGSAPERRNRQATARRCQGGGQGAAGQAAGQRRRGPAEDGSRPRRSGRCSSTAPTPVCGATSSTAQPAGGRPEGHRQAARRGTGRVRPPGLAAGPGRIRGEGTSARRAGRAAAQAVRPVPGRPRRRVARGGGMAAAAVGPAGQGQGDGGRVAGVRGGDWCKAGGKAGADQAGHHEGQGAGAVVRQRPGADDGGHSRAGGVPDGIAADGGRPGRGAGGEDGATAPEADRPLVCHRRQGSDGGAVHFAVPQGKHRRTLQSAVFPDRPIAR